MKFSDVSFQEKQELVEKYDKLKSEYDLVKEEADKLREKCERVQNYENSLKIIRKNFDSVLLTAQNEIDRLKRQNETTRKEMDDYMFRRTRPKVRETQMKDNGTQTDAVRKYNCGVQVTLIEMQNEKISENPEKNKKETDRRTDRKKRLRSRSREKSSKASSRQSESENERKKSKNDHENYSRREKEREKIRNPKNIEICKRNRSSEEKSSKSKDRKQEKFVERKIKRKTPRKSLKSDIDFVEQRLEEIHASEVKSVSETKKSKKEKDSNYNVSNKKMAPVQDLRDLLKSRKISVSDPDKLKNSELEENHLSNGISYENTEEKLPKVRKTVKNEMKLIQTQGKPHVKPLELLW